MEKLNEYLQTLLSSFSYELRLEPNKIPYIVSESGTIDVAHAPMLGTQISTMIFPLIPTAVKMELPNKPEIEFVHNHTLGSFNFAVKKSPAGFIVSIRPVIAENAQGKAARHQSEPLNVRQNETGFYPAAPETQVNPVSLFNNSVRQETASPVADTQNYTFESSSSVFENETKAAETFAAPIEIKIEEVSGYSDSADVYALPPIETVPVNSPEFVTTFSDDSTYEPPGKRNDFAADKYVQPASDFSQTSDTENQPQYNQINTVKEPENYPQAQNYQPAQNYQMPPQMQQVPQYVPQQMPPYIPPPQEAEFVPAAANASMKARMDALFYRMAEVGASDLHMSVSMPPMIRKDGKMMTLQCNEQTLSPEMMKQLLTSIMPSRNQEEFARRSDSDFAYEIPNLARFRANIFADRKGMGGVFRIIPTKILTAEQLGLSPAIMNLCDLSKGLVVVTGPTGSGKSTTLCAMVDSINKNREDHIITIEDPIEFTHENQRCLVNQREVHNHTDSFKDALRAALREDPDILLVGEMRDLETISIAIETAETGHLVFGTLHTTTACSTVDRIIDQFPADRQQQIRVMLSESLRGVIAQTLLPKKGGGRVAALEVLIITPAISNLIREGKTFQIPSAMQTGKQHGMVMLNDALFALVQKGLVEPRDAYIKAVDKTTFESMLTRGGFKI